MILTFFFLFIRYTEVPAKATKKKKKRKEKKTNKQTHSSVGFIDPECAFWKNFRKTYAQSMYNQP